MRDRSAEIAAIKSKGFTIATRESQEIPHAPLEFQNIRINTKQIEDAVLQLGDYKKARPDLANREVVLKAIAERDLPKLREISEFFYRASGIYARILRYMAFMYRYDWFVTPYLDDEKAKKEKLLEGFHNCLNDLDNFGVKKQFGEIALDILKYGCYYGYKVETSEGIVLQQLPANYCRSRWKSGKHSLVEFQMRFFDDAFKSLELKMKILKTFPPEFIKGYALYKQGKLNDPDDSNNNGWYPLDPGMTVRFTVNGEEYPAFISVIPYIIDLDEGQDLDRQKTKQRLLKILIQKMPLDKNGDLIFDVDEAKELHNNAVRMLSRAIGIDVLTTFADVEVEDMADSTVASAQNDDLERRERSLYNEAGVSQNQFNTDGNLALEKSILNDESTMYNMLLQFEEFLNDIVKKYDKKGKFFYRVQLLTTTIYNYQTLAKLYKEQMQVGFSKMLPQIALGQTQSSILATAYFENDILDLVNVFIPPLMSSTMNSDVLNRNKEKVATGDGEKSSGRPTNEEKGESVSDKTIQNKESQS